MYNCYTFKIPHTEVSSNHSHDPFSEEIGNIMGTMKGFLHEYRIRPLYIHLYKGDQDQDGFQEIKVLCTNNPSFQKYLPGFFSKDCKLQKHLTDTDPVMHQLKTYLNSMKWDKNCADFLCIINPSNRRGDENSSTFEVVNGSLTRHLTRKQIAFLVFTSILFGLFWFIYLPVMGIYKVYTYVTDIPVNQTLKDNLMTQHLISA